MKESSLFQINEDFKKSKFDIPTENIGFCNLILSQCFENEKIDISFDFLKNKFPLFKFKKKKEKDANNKIKEKEKQKDDEIKKYTEITNKILKSKDNEYNNLMQEKEKLENMEILQLKIEENNKKLKELRDKKDESKIIINENNNNENNNNENNNNNEIKGLNSIDNNNIIIKQPSKIEITKKNETFLGNIGNDEDIKYKFKNKLINGCNNFIKIKDKLKNIAFEDKYKDISDKILISLTPTVNQLNSFEIYDEKLQKLKSDFDEIKETKNKELYIITCNELLSLIFNKSLSSINESKTKFYLFSKIIYNIKSSTLINLFFQRIAYYCPYIIPIQYTEKDFSDKNELRKRQGFIEEGEQLTDFNNRMTCYEYLYFTFLFNDYEKYKPIIIEYIDLIDESAINFAIGNSYKVFLNVFGNTIKDEFLNKIKSISNKIKKSLDNDSKNSNISNIKSISGSNSYQIKELMKKIDKGKYTDFYEDYQNI